VNIKTAWFVRAGEGAFAIDEFRDNNEAAVGWREVDTLVGQLPDDEILRRFEATFPAAKKNAVRVWAAQVRRWEKDVSVGDPIMSYDPGGRVYLIGTVESEPTWRDDHDLCRVRKVRWTHQVFRDGLSSQTRNSLGSIATLFQVSEAAWAEVTAKRSPIGEIPPAGPVEGGEEEPEAGTQDIREQARELIEDRLVKLSWQDMQHLVAGILRAMGLHTRVSAAGPDRGVDIFASPDGLGLQEPRVFVEVKHRPRETIGAPAIRSFLGGRHTGDRCLFVATGKFAKDARYEAERSQIPLTLVDLPELASLFLRHYERLDAETRDLVPLVHVYWPVET
jgi:restriction system protein